MSAPLFPVAFETLATLLKTRSGLIIGTDKVYLLETRLSGIIKREKLADLNALAERLRRPGTDLLAREVVEAMTTNESFFFRDDKPFAHFRAQALPRLIAARPPGTPLRVWSAASSSGQEAYSLAMSVAESAGMLAGRKVEIIGTDIAREQLAKAREGVYSQFEVQRGLPVQLLMRYFRKEEASWRLSDTIRAMAQFREFKPAVRPPLARPVRHRVLPQCVDLFRPADQGARIGRDCRPDAARRSAVSRRRRNRIGNHHTVRPHSE